jgi:hypothetical protein
MRFISSLVAPALLAGCSAYSPVSDAWRWSPPPQKVTLSTPEAAALTNQIAQLQIQRTDIRNRISAESDIWARQLLYAELHDVGMRLSPLERRLALAAPAR